jgi:hypothetical protein
MPVYAPFKTLDPLEEVHVRELAHFLHVICLDYLFIVEKHPAGGASLTALELLANKCHVVSKVVSSESASL